MASSNFKINITAGFGVDVIGGADEVQTRIKAFSGQTSDIFQVTNNSGTAFVKIDSSGNLISVSQTIVKAGLVSSPGVAITGSLTTGLYSSAANNLDFASNGVNSGNISATATWTVGPASSDAIVHILNGSWSTGTVIPSFSSSNRKYVGSKFGNFMIPNATNLDIGIRMNGYFDGTNDKFTTTSRPAANFSLRSGTAASDPAFRFFTNPSIGNNAGDTLSYTDVGFATFAGDWTLGRDTANILKLNNALTANGTAALTMANGPGSGTRAAVGYLTINVNGSNFIIPYFATA